MRGGEAEARDERAVRSHSLEQAPAVAVVRAKRVVPVPCVQNTAEVLTIVTFGLVLESNLDSVNQHWPHLVGIKFSQLSSQVTGMRFDLKRVVKPTYHTREVVLVLFRG